MKILKAIIRVTIKTCIGFYNWIEDSLKHFATLLNVVLPFATYLIGQYVRDSRGKIAYGSEIMIPVLVGIIIYYLRSVANEIGKGSSVPVPERRFTEEEDDGEVLVDQDRLQELILYMDNLENWLERKGYL